MQWLKSSNSPSHSDSRSHSHSHSHSHSDSHSKSHSKSNSPVYSQSTPTSNSLLSLFVVFSVVFVYLRATQPLYVMDPSDSTILSYRLVTVYSLLYSTSVALVVFAYYYFLGTTKKKE